MKCKHMHKDAPEDAVCGDCYRDFKLLQARFIIEYLKGGIKHENN